MKGLFRAAFVVGAALFSIGATPNWNAMIVKTDGGHRLGNPDAQVKLVAFESYTCPHCSQFEKDADGPLRIAYIQSGKLSLEVRHIIRDPVDLTVTVLANCGAPAKFFDNHRIFMLDQAKWIGPMVNSTKAQRDRWLVKGGAGRRAIASDFGFYAIMASRGYSRVSVDQCLNDDALAAKLAAQTKANDEEYDITGTPSFAINGLLLLATHEWSLLRPQIDARL